METIRKNPALLDPGWLFLLAGVAVLGATLLIPAGQDLDDARWLRDRALAIEAHRQQRLDRYQEYIEAIDRREPALITSLATSQLNKIPVDRGVIPGLTNARNVNASVFPALEPDPLNLPERHLVESRLSKLASGERTRLWLIAGGAGCMLIGLMPASRRRQ